MAESARAPKLSAEDVAEMQEVFNNFDVNGDGTIDISELATILRSLGFNPSRKQLEVIMQQV